MRRMWLSDLTVCSQYLRQMAGIGVFVAVCVTLGMRTVVGVACTLCVMLTFSMTMVVGAYDEPSRWESWRLTMPLSRRDVVLGRYATVVTVAVAGLLVGFAASVLIAGACWLVPLPAGWEGMAVSGAEDVLATVFAGFFGLFVGCVMMAVVLPFLFKWGSTKLTQRLPLIVLAVAVAPMFVLGSLEDADVGALATFLSWLETPAGVAATAAVAVLVAAVALAASVAISVRVYEKREL